MSNNKTDEMREQRLLVKILNFSDKQRLPEKSQIVLDQKIKRVSVNTSITHFNLFDTYERDGNTYLLLINKKINQIEILNIFTNKIIFSKALDNIVKKPNDYGEISSIEFVNFDSIFLLQEKAITLIDTTMEKLAIDINKGEDLDYSNCILSNLDHAPIYFNEIDQSLSIQSYCHTCYVYDIRYYQAPIHVSFSLENHKFKPLPIHYSNMYLDDYFGFHNLVFRSEYEDKYIVGFSADTDFYIFDKNAKKAKTHNGKSKFQLFEIEHLKKKYKNDSNKKLRHLTLFPIYKEILYDEKRSLYYRFLLNGIQEKNPDGTYNSWNDKELILMIFDGELKLIKEVNLGKGVYNSSKSFVGDNGLYLLHFQQEDSLNLNKIDYDLYEFH